MATDPPMVPRDGELRAVSLQVELDPIEKGDLPVSIIQVLPLNEVKIRDMRENFQVTQLSVLSILAHFGGQSVDLPIDYNHGMWTGEDNSAAGWGEKVIAVVPDEWYDRIAPFIEQYGDRVTLLTSEDESLQGVFVFVRWTEKAAELIRNREYRYVSPVIFFSYTGEANYLWNAAIVNSPAIDGMEALAASIMPPAGRKMQVKDGTSSPSDVADGDDGTEPNSENLSTEIETEQKEGDAEMPNLNKFVELFGLEIDTEADDFDAEACEAIVFSEIEAVRAKADTAEALAAENEQVKAKLEEVEGSLAETSDALMAANEKVEAFENAAADDKAAREAAKIDEAIEAGQLAASQREWAVGHFEAFEALVETLADNPQGPPQGRQTKEDREPEELSTGDDRSQLRERIKAYAEEKGISFTEAHSLLSKEQA